MRYQISPPPLNPVSRLLAGIAAMLALAGAVFFGVFVLALVLGLGVILSLAVGLRLWWFRKKMGRPGVRVEGSAQARDPRAERQDGEGGKVIDAEYEVVSRRRER
ncbi:MAG: hypothetical protein RQ826_00650 [Xanthomonadales bacterium]|nr:hypothetical protein [Xanthomonadales bacterium]